MANTTSPDCALDANKERAKSFFLVDSGFGTSENVIKIPREIRLEAIGLWAAVGSQAAGMKSGREVAFRVLESLEAPKHLVSLLVWADLWEYTDNGIRFVNNSRQPNHGFERGRPHIPKAVRKAVYERDNWQCKYCDSIDELQVDHIFPWSKGGAHEISNFQTLCRICNSMKSDNLF